MATGDLVSLADAKAFLGATGADDQLIARLVTAASQYIQDYINRTFGPQAYNDVWDGNGSSRMMFPNYPVTAVASVILDGFPLTPWPGYGVNSAASLYGFYSWDSKSLKLMNGQKFTRQFSNVQVSYTAGYVTIPEDIRQATIDILARKYKQRDRIGLTSKTLAGETVVFDATDLTADVKTILKNYSKVIPV